ncbi:Fibronectin, type III domain protein [Candidatus Magnetobacterium bavaricum]|uniref:Fibronectin, type III domain protein n=1 Tax=Candidatus Magnetobacterium bavaricum TaxID=29290 RepID=A0A0F3GPN8_9BACT|nr:Fibronectin, type III domain protein [Candidatus Magnetobacterium bavaricum]
MIDHFSDAFEILGNGAGSIGYSASISQSTGIKITGMEFEGGKIGLKGTPIILKDFVLSFSSDTLTAGGGFEIKHIKTGINGGAFSLTIKSDSIEAFTLEVDGNVPIGSVFFINELEGGAEGFKTPPIKVHLRGLFSGGPDIGGFKFVCLNVEGELSFDSVLSGSASGGLLCFDEGNDQGLINKNGAISSILEASLDWKTPSLTANGKLNFPFDVLKGNSKFAINSQSINGDGVFDICAPDVVPYIGGKCAAQTKAILNMKGAGGEIGVWGDWLRLAYFVDWKIAQAKSVKDTANYIHVGTNLNTLGVNQQSAFRYIEKGLQTRAITTISVPNGLGVVLIRLDWQTGSTDFNVTMPDGTKITPANAANSQTYVYQKLSNEAWYAIKNPQGGTYTIEIGDGTSAANDVSSIGTYQLSYHSLTNPPTIKITSPITLTAASTSLNIQYDAHDSDDTAKISLFYSKDNTSANGTLIVDNLVEQDGPGSYTWDVTNVPNGTYYVYALIDDGKNAPVVSYSTGAVKISHGATVTVPTNLKATVTGNQVDLSWTGVSNSSGYIIHYTDDVKQLTYKDKVAVASNAAYYSMKNLKSNTTYRITITSFDDNLIEGDEATPVTASIAAVATPTIALSTDAIDFGTTVAGTTYTKKFTISNTGSAALTISEMFTLGTNSNALTLTTSSLPIQIQSNGSAEITVTMVAPSTPLIASIVIKTNDPINPSMQVSATTATSTQSTTYALTVTKSGNGTITASTGTLTWSGNTGTATYTSGTSVTLTATPTQDSRFGGWTGCDSTSGNQCTVAMSSNRSVSVSFTQGVCSLCKVPRMDFNGNGKGDILWRNVANNMMYIWLMNGINIASGGLPAMVGPEWQTISVGDFNGDGNTDIVWYNTSTGMVYIWLMGGAKVTGGGSPATLGPEWQIESIGDFNADGKSDIMWRNTSNILVIVSML